MREVDKCHESNHELASHLFLALQLHIMLIRRKLFITADWAKLYLTARSKYLSHEFNIYIMILLQSLFPEKKVSHALYGMWKVFPLFPIILPPSLQF